MKQDLSDAIEAYHRFRRSQGLSKQTLRNEKSTLKAFLAANGNIGCHQISERHVTLFTEEAGKTRGASSMAPVDSCLRQFFAWCRHTRRMPMDSDPMFGRRRPKVVKRERQRIHVSKFHYMLDEAEKLSPWHRALTATLLYTLLRGGDATDLRVRDVDLDAGYLTARISKVGKEDRLPISSDLDGELRRWLTAYTKEVGVLSPSFYLIPRRATAPFHGEDKRWAGAKSTLCPDLRMGQVAHHIKPVLATVGIVELGEGGHTIRRSGARAMFDHLSDIHHPRPLRVVRDMLHHASEAQSEKYIGVEADRLDRDLVVRGKPLYGFNVENVRYLDARRRDDEGVPESAGALLGEG